MVALWGGGGGGRRKDGFLAMGRESSRDKAFAVD
jgi:hypothetical protein